MHACRSTLEDPTAASLVFAVLGALLNDRWHIVGAALGYASIVALALVFVVGWRDRSGTATVKRWRGKDIDLKPPKRFR